jgi:hypothetical protein
MKKLRYSGQSAVPLERRKNDDCPDVVALKYWFHDFFFLHHLNNLYHVYIYHLKAGI